jgi:hypothetical protein
LDPGNEATSIPIWTKNKLWKYSTRILCNYVTGSYYAHQYDWSCFFGTLAELQAWIRKEAPAPEFTWAEAITEWARGMGYMGPVPG